MNIGILGFGTVSSSLVNHFLDNTKHINSECSEDINIIKIATRTVSKVNVKNKNCIITNDLLSVVTDDNIDVIVELIGGVNFAKDIVIKAIKNKKHVVTANKALLALHGEELFKLALENKVFLLFEGAVSVAIPIIKSIKESFAANKITKITGILNGTSNYILSQMYHKDIEFNKALKEAQDKGYSEANPELDISGADSAHKIAILAYLSFGSYIDFSKIYYDGISNVNQQDVKYTKDFNLVLKQVATAKNTGKHINVKVETSLIDDQNMLSNVENSMNGILLYGSLFGKSFFYGAGAGGIETSSAILGDLIDLTYYYKYKTNVTRGKRINNLKLSNVDYPRKYYIRVRANRNLKLEEFKNLFKKFNIPFANIKKYLNEDYMDITLTTDYMKKNQITEMIDFSVDVVIDLVYYPII